MANVISLHKRQLFIDGVIAAYGTLQVYESGTLTQVSVYADADLLTERAQPILADANGVVPVCYVASAAPLRLLAKDEDANPLPGYPMDSILPEAIGGTGADQISAAPFDEITGLTVQAQLEQIYEVASSNEDLVSARFTPWTTSGTGNAYTITPTPAATTYGAGQSWMVRPNRSNTGAATLNVSGLGTRNLKKYGTGGTLVDFAAGEIQAYREILAYDDGTQIVVLLGRDFPFRTTNGNGTSVRYADGTQMAWIINAGPFVFNDGSTLEFTWTFPSPFSSSEVAIFKSGAGAIDNYTGVSRTHVGQFTHGGGTTSADCLIWGVAGGDAFLAGDEISGVRLFAVGRWF